MGGLELYVLNKTKWLEENGWEVHIFSTILTFKKYRIQELNRFKSEAIPLLVFSPFEIGKSSREKILTKIIKFVNPSLNDEIIIESHSGSTALWGELVAKKINARHTFQPKHEYFTEDCYTDSKDFFIYMLNNCRVFAGELAKERLIQTVLKENPSKAKSISIAYNPIANLDNSKLNEISKADYTICYIGRTEKPYFASIVDGVKNFAILHKENSVQFVVVGKSIYAKKIVKKRLCCIRNLSIKLLDEMFPIPRKLFSLVDVVCAGSGAARSAVFESVPVLIPDPYNYLCNGVYGYETKESTIADPSFKQSSFLEAFERTLVLKDFKRFDFLFDNPRTVSECCENNLQLIYNIEKPFEYYSFNNAQKCKKTLKKSLKIFLIKIFPHLPYYLDWISNRVRR